MKPGTEMANFHVRKKFIQAYYVNLLENRDRMPWLWDHFLDGKEEHLGDSEANRMIRTMLRANLIDQAYQKLHLSGFIIYLSPRYRDLKFQMMQP